MSEKSIGMTFFRSFVLPSVLGFFLFSGHRKEHSRTFGELGFAGGFKVYEIETCMIWGEKAGSVSERWVVPVKLPVNWPVNGAEFIAHGS